MYAGVAAVVSSGHANVYRPNISSVFKAVLWGAQNSGSDSTVRLGMHVTTSLWKKHSGIVMKFHFILKFHPCLCLRPEIANSDVESVVTRLPLPVVWGHIYDKIYQETRPILRRSLCCYTNDINTSYKDNIANIHLFSFYFQENAITLSQENTRYSFG